MSKYWQTRTFKDIETEWNLKLKEAGFVDAEITIKEERHLIQNSPNAYRGAPEVIRELKAQYYEAISHCMEYAPPRDRTERFIMHSLSLGSNISEICELLKEMGGPCHRQTVRFIVRKYEHLWGIRTWETDKLNPKWRTARIK